MIQAYCIRCITNLHAGSSGESHAIIDKTVQRDVSTGYPTIHSSSLKGALREFFEEKLGWGKDDPRILHIFGGQPKQSQNAETPGKYTFFSANMLSMPVRSNGRPFYRASSPALIQDLQNQLSNYRVALPEATQNALTTFKRYRRPTAAGSGSGQVFLEDYLIQEWANNETLEGGLVGNIGEYAVLLPDESLGDIARNLPVIARNQLEDGISQNLWYEEVVPRETRFFVLIGSPDADAHWAEFQQALTGNIIQIGGNASIGYGQCKFSNLS